MYGVALCAEALHISSCCFLAVLEVAAAASMPFASALDSVMSQGLAAALCMETTQLNRSQGHMASISLPWLLHFWQSIVC